jgi:DSF synthase
VATAVKQGKQNMAVSIHSLRELVARTRNDNRGGLPARRHAAPTIALEPRGLDWEALAAGYRELELRFEPADGILFCAFRHRERPCYTDALLAEMRDLQLRLQRHFAHPAARAGMELRYLVWRSACPGVWSLGGDLELFTRCIRTGDEDELRRYAHLCIDTLHANLTSLGLPIVTVALIEGDALGGGFEACLSDDLRIATRGSQFGLPEVLFNLFPGMGGYSFLSRKVGAAMAERMILSGRIYSAEELHELGLVDILAEPGQAEAALHTHIARHQRRHAVQRAIARVGQHCQPVAHAELIEVTDIWVDTAMDLDELDLRKMDRLAAAQRRRVAQPQSTPLTA